MSAHTDQEWPARGDVVTLADIRSARGRTYTGEVVSTPADGWSYLTVDYAPDEWDANVWHGDFPHAWTWTSAPPGTPRGVVIPE
ncbi:hypothetical protein ACFQ6C_26685 [Streptomyces sp. NPDC056454]|uniref:hypothetical protein n=1 Tax=Streptomyces sp. NPDC056454 TaxID=3345823 RepID=UPI003698C755